MRIASAALMYNKSYGYITRNDFLKAYGRNQTVFAVKNVKKMFVDFDDGEDEEEEEKTEETSDIPFLLMLSEVHQPIHLQLVNTAPIKSRRIPANLNLLCDEKLPVDGKNKVKRSIMNISKKSKQTDKMNLFKRRMRVKNLLDLTKDERESLANVVLSRQKSKDQSHFTSRCEETTESAEPEFISVVHPVDFDYYDSYSIEEVSVHDLFDFDVDAPENLLEEYEYVESYIEEEHLEDDE